MPIRKIEFYIEISSFFFLPFQEMSKDFINKLFMSLSEIKTSDKLNFIGLLITKYRPQLTPRTFQTLVKNQDELHLYGKIGLALIPAPEMAPTTLYNFILVLLPDISPLNSFQKFSLYMRLVQAAVYSNNAKSLWSENIIKKVQQVHPSLYTAPLAFLACMTGHAVEPPSILHSNPRIAALTLFYCGLNFLIQKNYQEAYRNLMQATCFIDLFPDMRAAFLQKYSLAAFLNHVPSEVFFQNFNNDSPSDVHFLWSLDMKTPRFLEELTSSHKFGSSTHFYSEFAVEISKEHSKRLILKFSRVISLVSKQELANLVGIGNSELKSLIRDLEKSDGLTIEQNGDILILHEAPVEPILERELNQVSELLPLLKQS